jgi:hypothetical protein
VGAGAEDEVVGGVSGIVKRWALRKNGKERAIAKEMAKAECLL